MICPDCQGEILPPRKHSARYTEGHYCKNCKREHIVWEEVKDGDCVFQTGRMRFYCDYTNNKCLIQRLYMDIESDTSIVYRWGTLLELPTIPNLNENNFEEKMKLYLLFS